MSDSIPNVGRSHRISARHKISAFPGIGKALEKMEDRQKDLHRCRSLKTHPLSGSKRPPGLSAGCILVDCNNLPDMGQQRG
jgi:hypothetical protein